MIEQIISFLKKTYGVPIVILTAVIFFLGYNTYLVDYSLANLRTTLIKVNNVAKLDDAKKLIPLLEVSLLNEVISRELQIQNLSYIELAKDVLDKSKDITQLEDVKFALKEAIAQKEKERFPALVVLDKAFVPLAEMPSKAKLESRAKAIKRRIATTRDKRILQDIYYDLASTYVRLEEFDSAKEAYREVVLLSPRTKLAERAQFNLAWNEKFQGNLDGAIKQFEVFSQTTQQESLAIFSKYQIAEIYKLRGDYEKAIAIYKEITEKYPNSELNKLAGFQICYAYLHGLKKYDEAEDAFEKINDVCKDSDLSVRIAKTKLRNIASRYNQMGFNLLREGYGLSFFKEYYKEALQKYKEALGYFDKALGVSFEDAIAYIGKALAYLWLGEPDRALEFARKAKKLQRRNEFVVLNLSYIYIQLDLTDEALAECKSFVLLKPRSFQVYYNLGFVYILQNEIKDAADAFYKVTRIGSRFAPAFNNLGYCLWYLKKYAEAIRVFEKTVNLDPKILEGHLNLGLAYAEIGKYKEAEKKFTDALNINPQYFEAQVCLREVKRIIKEKDAIGTSTSSNKF